MSGLSCHASYDPNRASFGSGTHHSMKPTKHIPYGNSFVLYSLTPFELVFGLSPGRNTFTLERFASKVYK
jgi:hypothetical protein